MSDVIKIAVDVIISNKCAADFAEGNEEIAAYLAEDLENYSGVLRTYLALSGCDSMVDGVRWCEAGSTFNKEGRVFEIGVHFARGASERSTDLMLAHLAGLARYARWQEREDAKRYGDGQGEKRHWSNLARLQYADEMALELTSLTLRDWANWVLETLKIENVNAGKDLPCGGDSLVARYEHLVCDSMEGECERGEPLNFRVELLKYGY